MAGLRRWIARLLNSLRHTRAEAELAREMDAHLTQIEDDYRRRGLSAEAARRAARQAMNGVEQTKERHRDVRAFRWLDDLRRDLRYAVRGFARTPAFALAVVLTLALGIGANAALFSVVYGVLLRPLPYREADRLVLVQREQTMAGARRPVPVTFFEPGALETWTRGMPSLEAAALYSIEVAALSAAGGSELLDSAVVSGSFFSTLSGPVAVGRPLEAADETTASVVVSDRLARRLFTDPASALGRPLTLTSQSYVVVGVADAAFQFPSADTDVWMPATFVRSANPRCCGFRFVGRLAPAASLDMATLEAEGLTRAQAASNPDAPPDVRVTVVGLHDQSVAQVRPAILVLMAAAGLTLLVACANVVNLLLARRAAREREMATRLMLGASRTRLVRQALAESALAASAAALAGIALARVVVAVLTGFETLGVPRLDAIRIDRPVFLFTTALAIAVSMATAVLPGFQVGQADGSLRLHGAGNNGPRRRLRQALCVVQLAAALVLLIGASLLGRSLFALTGTDLGVVPDRVVTASLNFGMGGPRPSDADVVARTGHLLREIASVPGVTAAGVGTSLPPNQSRLRLTLRRAGETVDYQASGVAATPGYFDALGMRLVSGRMFTAADDLEHPPVMIMTVDTARRFFGDGDPVGQTMSLPVTRDGKNGREEMTLVGIVANVKYSGLDAEADDAVYRPFGQQAWIAPFLVARTSSDPDDLTGTLRRHVGRVDPALVLSDVRTLTSIVSDAAAQPRFRTVLLATMAGLAVAMAAVGLYGVVAYSVSQRTQEIGVRMALGAGPGDVLGMVLREGLRMALVGVAGGVLAAMAAARALSGLLFGVAPGDPLSFAIAAAGLLAVTLVSSYLPARRAAHVDPIVALRWE